MATSPHGSDSDEFAMDPIVLAISEVAAGRPVIVLDAEIREAEGDLVVAAENVTPKIIAFMMSECRDLICAPIQAGDVDRLDLLREQPFDIVAQPHPRLPAKDVLTDLFNSSSSRDRHIST